MSTNIHPGIIALVYLPGLHAATCAPVANDVEYIIEAVYSVDPNESLIVNCTCLVSELIQSQAFSVSCFRFY